MNLQKTPVDESADLVIHGFVDDVIEKLMAKLNLAIPQFHLSRWMQVEITTSRISGRETLRIAGLDETGGPYDLFQGSNLNAEEGVDKIVLSDKEKNFESNYKILLSFHNHYNENQLLLKLGRWLLGENENKLRINMKCNPFKGNQQQGLHGEWYEVTAYDQNMKQLGPLEFESVPYPGEMELE